MGTFITEPAKAWILPVGSEDFQVIKGDVASYEKDGELRLVESAGTITGVEPAQPIEKKRFTVPPHLLEES
jgi:hypothetical protein